MQVRCAGLAALLALAAPLFGDPIALQPYTIDHLNRVDSAADVSFLLSAPAGKDGFVRAENGHLFTPDGKRFRMWGVCLTGFTAGSTNIPPKEAAPIWAAEMARYGINCVRFHFLDMPSRSAAGGGRGGFRGTAGLIDNTLPDTQHFDPVALDRLDFFIAELKKRGIYSDLNLNVGRTYKPGDGVPDSQLFGAAGKGFTFLGERLLQLQRDYAKLLLTHMNPYTQKAYVDEPAVAIVEIVNENSMYEFWARNWLRGERGAGGANYQLDLTPGYEKLLTQKYNDWLAATLSRPAVNALRAAAGVKEGELVPRLRRGEFADAPQDRFQAEANFYGQVERDFFDGMKSYLKDTLGVKSLIIGCADHTYFIPNQPMLRAMSRMDAIDGHVYWQHPDIWGERNTPMVNDPLHSSIVKLTRSPFLNKPFTVSEVNEPNPNEYAAEMIPILASYAGFQDWDGIFFYTFELKTDPAFQPFVSDRFDITQDPVKMAQMEAGALIFLRGDVQPAKQVIARTYSTEQINESLRLPEAERPYFTPGFPLSLPLRHGSRIRALDAEPTQAFAPDTTNLDADAIVSDTGELVWNISKDKGGLVTVDTERSQALVGFVRDHNKTLRHLSARVKNDFCAITLSSLDNKPIARSNTMLLTLGSKIENTGTVWNDRRTLWSTWGTAPTLIEPVTGWITLHDIDGAVNVQVIPLDGAARPIATGRGITGKRNEDGWEFSVGEPATTMYLIRVAR
jgi:hypothetical protein